MTTATQDSLIAAIHNDAALLRQRLDQAQPAHGVMVMTTGDHDAAITLLSYIQDRLSDLAALSAAA